MIKVSVISVSGRQRDQGTNEMTRYLPTATSSVILVIQGLDRFGSKVTLGAGKEMDFVNGWSKHGESLLQMGGASKGKGCYEWGYPVQFSFWHFIRHTSLASWGNTRRTIQLEEAMEAMEYLGTIRTVGNIFSHV